MFAVVFLHSIFESKERTDMFIGTVEDRNPAPPGMYKAL